MSFVRLAIGRGAIDSRMNGMGSVADSGVTTRTTSNGVVGSRPSFRGRHKSYSLEYHIVRPGLGSILSDDLINEMGSFEESGVTTRTSRGVVGSGPLFRCRYQESESIHAAYKPVRRSTDVVNFINNIHLGGTRSRQERRS